MPLNMEGLQDNIFQITTPAAEHRGNKRSMCQTDTDSDDAERNEKKSKKADTERNEKKSKKADTEQNEEKSKRAVTQINDIITQSDMSPPSTSDAVQSPYDRASFPWMIEFPENVSEVNCALEVKLKNGDKQICVLTTFHTIITKRVLQLVSQAVNFPSPKTDNNLPITHFRGLLNHILPPDPPQITQPQITQPQITQPQINEFINQLNSVIQQKNRFVPQIYQPPTIGNVKTVAIPIKSVTAGVFTEVGRMEAVLLELDMKEHRESKIRGLTNVKLHGRDSLLPITSIKSYLGLPDSTKKFFAESGKWIYLHSSHIAMYLPQTKPDRSAGKALLRTSNKRDIDNGNSGSPIYERGKRGNLATGEPVARLIGMVVTKHEKNLYGGSIFMTSKIVKALKSSLDSITQIDLLRPTVKDLKPQSEDVDNSPEISNLVLDSNSDSDISTSGAGPLAAPVENE